jgi:hypothetical protein
MKIRIEGTAEELAALQVIHAEIGAEDAAPELVKAAALEAAGEQGLAAAWRARATPSLTPALPAALVIVEEWMAARRGWRFERADVVDERGVSVVALRASYQAFFGAGRFAGATLEVWIDVGAGELRAMLPPHHKSIPGLVAELNDLIDRVTGGSGAPLIHPRSVHVVPPSAITPRR